MKTAERTASRAQQRTRRAQAREDLADRSIVSLELQAMEDLQRLTSRLTAAARRHASEDERAGAHVEMKALLAHELPVMERQLEHMARLFDDLAEIARIEDRTLELTRTRVLLEDVISTAIENARDELIAAGHDLELDIPSEPVLLDADHARLAHAIGTLVANSARYTPREGLVTIEAKVDDDGEVTISVRDNLPGRREPSIASVFGMLPAPSVALEFERTSGGLWIGLALVKGLVDLHGGSVMAESDGPGAGTTYSIRLPISATQ